MLSHRAGFFYDFYGYWGYWNSCTRFAKTNCIIKLSRPGFAILSDTKYFVIEIGGPTGITHAQAFCLLDNLTACSQQTGTVDNTGMVTPVNVKRFQIVENTSGQAQLALPRRPGIAS